MYMYMCTSHVIPVLLSGGGGGGPWCDVTVGSRLNDGSSNDGMSCLLPVTSRCHGDDDNDDVIVAVEVSHNTCLVLSDPLPRTALGLRRPGQNIYTCTMHVHACIHVVRIIVYRVCTCTCTCTFGRLERVQANGGFLHVHVLGDCLTSRPFAA